MGQERILKIMVLGILAIVFSYGTAAQAVGTTAGTIYTGSALGSLTLRTDANDGDPGYYNSGADNVECGSVGAAVVNVGPGSTWYCQFDVTID